MGRTARGMTRRDFLACVAGGAAVGAVAGAWLRAEPVDAPFYPVGLHSVPLAEIPSVPSASFNVIDDPSWAQGWVSTPEYQRVAGENGFLLIAGFPFAKVAAQDLAYIDTYVDAVKDMPYLACWELVEEPAYTGITVRDGEAAYNAVHALDPDRPVLMVDFQLAHVTEYADCYDIFAYDHYPIGNCSIAYWAWALRQVVEAASPKPVWAVIQAFGHDDPRASWALPIAAELRSMVYVAILRGALGTLFYTHGVPGGSFYIRDHAKHWAYLQKLAAELRAFAPILVSSPARQSVTTGNGQVEAWLFSSGTDLYLVAANIGHTTPAVNRHFPGVAQSSVTMVLDGASTGKAELVGSAGTGSAQAGRRVNIRRGTLTDAFDPYAVHIYSLKLW